MKRTVIEGDALLELRKLPARIAHVAITSPPYWGLRDYGTGTWLGGSADCDHRVKTARNDGGRENVGGFHGSAAVDSGKGEIRFRTICRKCGARRLDEQLGLERTPDLYVARLVEVFRELRRVLRNDGTLWLVLGDCFNAYNGGAGPSSSLSQTQSRERPQLPSGYGLRFKGLKPKDLVGIPWRVAFALQVDGWYLRSDIIWAKPNPMPESVVDRPTRAHEYLFLFSKRESYYYDADAVREPWTDKNPNDTKRAGLYIRYKGKHRITEGNKGVVVGDPKKGRNRRSVWTITTRPFKGAHFATFPPELVRPCLLAGAPVGGVALDPFFGSGTVGVVAKEEGRGYIGIELNPDYCEMARRRIAAAKEKAEGE